MRLILVFVFFLGLLSCRDKVKPDFEDWLNSQTIGKTEGESPIYQKNYYSSTLSIDTIYRSMQGPYEIKLIDLMEPGEEILWIRGYRSSLISSENQQAVSNAFMCHNNLNYHGENQIPWQIKTTGANSRIFTLSEGQVDLKFPEGFGIPVPNGQRFEMVSQVLNHNFPDTNLNIQHKVSLDYSKGSESSGLKALYQQSVFITRQIAGPAGEYGLPKLCISHHLDSITLAGKEPNHNCEIDFSESKYNPYEDQMGRKFTGHWKLPYGEEVLKTNVSRMLDLSEDTKIHAIGVHLHPFGKKLELWDKTKHELLYVSKVQELDSLLGFKHIEYYTSAEGIPLYKDHQYELISTYNCTDSTEEHTAMAVMYLYLAE